MTFKHKLARRLAGLPRIGLGILTVTALSCGDGALKEGLAPPTPPPPPTPAAQIIVTQDRDSLLVGDTTQFLAHGLTSAGDSVAVTVTWSTTDGSITAGGKYVPDTEGNHTVTAVATTDQSLRNDRRVRTWWRERHVRTIDVSPDSVTAQPGGRLILHAIGTWPNGRSDTMAVDWTAATGRFTPVAEGVEYTADSTPGPHEIVAHHLASNHSDTAVVMIAGGAPQLVGVVASPDSASLLPSESVQFSAHGVMSDGSSVAITPTWSATGGSVDGAGLYVAGGSEGNYWIIALDVASGLADTARVRIQASTPTLVGVQVSPSTASLTTGGTQNFSATGLMSDGSTAAVAVTWSATGGSIGASGSYTAGSTVGSYRAIAANGSLADTAQISVSSGPPPPPPPPPPPADLNLDFDDPNNLGVTCGGSACPFPGGTYRKHSYVATGGVNGTGAINMHWQTGMSIGFSPIWIDIGITPHFRLRYAVKQTAPMQHQGSAIKLMRMCSRAGCPGSHRIGTLESKQGQFVWYWDAWLEGAPVGAVSLNAAVPADSQWHVYELEIDYRTVGQLSVTFLLDGVLRNTVTRSATTNLMAGGSTMVLSPMAEMYSCGPSGCEATINTGDYTVDDFAFTVLP